jgi:hypothetical protein
LVKFLLKGNLEEYLFYKIFDNKTFSEIKNYDRRLRYEQLFTKNPSINTKIVKINNTNNNNKKINDRNINNEIENNCYNIDENNNGKKNFLNSNVNSDKDLNEQKDNNNKIEDEILSLNNPNIKFQLKRKNFSLIDQRKKNNNNDDISRNKINNKIDNNYNNKDHDKKDYDSQSKIIKDKSNLIRINNEYNNFGEENKKENDGNLEK